MLLTMQIFLTFKQEIKMIEEQRKIELRRNTKQAENNTLLAEKAFRIIIIKIKTLIRLCILQPRLKNGFSQQKILKSDLTDKAVEKNVIVIYGFSV
jgi:hypothetical protein